jgi:hypothetical protein
MTALNLTESMDKLRDALEAAEHGPGFAVAEWDTEDEPDYAVIDGDGETVAVCGSMDVAQALADLCNAATC